VSTRAIDALVPETFPRGWHLDGMRVPGMKRVSYRARRTGVTFVIHHDDSKWWTFQKLHGGKVLAEYVTTELPSRVHDALQEGVVLDAPRSRYGGCFARSAQAR
jgi:hypothetical protein